jgi:amino-acid N-acetyltransferase
MLQPLISKASSLDEIKALLSACRLPTQDIREDATFFAARERAQLCGVAGLEIFGDSALLRSVAVQPAWRRRGLARALCETIMDEARARGVRQLYLLTIDADRVFARLGFAPIERGALPDALRATAQFRELCPQTAIAMARAL